MLSSEIIDRRAVYTPAVLDSLYADVVRHYEDAVPSAAVQDDLVEMLGAVDGKSLHSWAVSRSSVPGERIEQLRAALSAVSVYDAVNLMNGINHRNAQPERDYIAQQKYPKNDYEGRYAFIMGYYLDNYTSLSKEEKAVFQQLDKVATTADLRQWASRVRVGHALDNLANLPASVREEVDELAYGIAELDEQYHDELLTGLKSVGMVDDQRMSALIAYSDRLHAQNPDEVVLFKNGAGMTAIGQDAERVLRATGWPANLVYYGEDKYVQLTNISSDGYEVLADKELNLRIVNAPVNMSAFREQPFNATGYALQTIDYSLSQVENPSVLLETDGSLNIGNFKAKTLDFHPTGLDAIADNGEKLVIRDIPANYYHPEGTLVVADYINGHRETIENALDAARPVEEHLNEDGERISVLDDYTSQKALHPDEILLFRQKGFVEAFGDDAEHISEALNVPLYERTIDGRRTNFVMIGMSDYVELSENATMNTHLAIPTVRDPRLDISQSIMRMHEQIDVEPSREGLAAEITQLSEGRYGVRLVDYLTLGQISDVEELSADEAARYASLSGPAAMSQRSDFVLDMANKYFGEQLSTQRQQRELIEFHMEGGLEDTPLLLMNSVPYEYTNADNERVNVTLNAYTVNPPYVMLYQSMEDAEQSFDPVMLSDLPDGLRADVVDSIKRGMVENQRLQGSRSQEVAQENQQPQKEYYRIVIGEDNRPGGVYGEYHVDFADNINAVSYGEMKALAEEYGGETHITEGHEWGDFYRREDAERFAQRIVALEQERMYPAQQAQPTNGRATDEELLSRDETFRYQLLGRLRSDANYFLGNGNRYEPGLWAGSVEEHLSLMNKLWDSLPEKPEWLTREQLNAYAEQMRGSNGEVRSIEEGTAEVRQLINEIGLDFSPLTPRIPVVDGETVYGHAMVTNSDILVFENRNDAYDGRNGVSLSELTEDKQREVLNVIKEQYGDENRQVTVLLETQQVPDYALSAIVNGDFDGIDNAEDEKNIRDFMNRDLYRGAMFVARDEQASFTSRPAFGPATDCVTMDILRTATIKELREEHQSIVKDLPFPEELSVSEQKEQLTSLLQELMPNNGDRLSLPKSESYFVPNIFGYTELSAKEIVRNGGNYRIGDGEMFVTLDRFPEQEYGSLYQLVKAAAEQQQQPLENRRYNDEESIAVKQSMGEDLQAVVNENFGNGDANNTELVETMQEYIVPNTRSAEDAARDLMIRVLNKADLNNPGILSRNGVADVEQYAERLAATVVKDAEAKLPSFVDTIVLNGDSVEEGVQLPLDENGEYEARMLFRDGMAHQIDDKGNYLPDGQGVVLDYPTLAVVKDDPFMQDKIEHTTQRRWDAGTIREQIYDIALHYGVASYGLQQTQQQDVVEGSDLREAKGYLIDVLDEARQEIGSVIDVPGSGVVYGEAPIGTEYVGGIEFDGKEYKTDNGLRIADLDSYADVYALTVAVREAQIVNILGAGGSVTFDGLTVSNDSDSLSAPRKFIDSLSVDDDGKLKIEGHLLDADGHKVPLEDGDFLELAGYDDLYAEVKKLQVSQSITEEETNSEDLALSAADQQLIKSTMVSYLKGIDSDYYNTELPIESRVNAASLESWSDVKRLATAIGDDILRTADANDPELLGRYGVENISHEAAEIGTDTLAKAREVIFNRDNQMFQQLDAQVATVNAMQAEYHMLRRGDDPNYMFKETVDHYYYEHNPRDEQQVALMEVKGGHPSYATSWLSASEVLSKLIEKQSELINEYPQLKEFTTMEEKNQEVAQQPEAQEQQEKKNRFENIDYTKYSMPEGAVVEKANVFKMTTGKDAGKYALSAVINGERKSRTLYYNDVTAFFNGKKGQDGAKATLDQLVAKYFGKSTAESMSIGSVGEAEKVRGEQKEAKEQAAAAEEQKQEAQAEQQKKKEEEAKKEKKEPTPAAIIQAELLAGALVAASQNDGVWLNKDGKQGPDFTRDNQVVSPFNALMMGLHSDANGYKTNRYMTFGDAKTAGVSVKKGESGLPFNWYNWDKYVSRINSNDVIDKAKYEALPAEEKDLYKVLRPKEERKIFNVDQTTMSAVAKPQYKELLAAQEKSVLGRGVKDVVEPAEGKTLFEQFKESNPDTLLILRTGEDRFELHGADAEKAAEILYMKLESKEGEAASLVIPEKQLDEMLPKLVRDGQRVSVQNNPDKPEVLRRYGTADQIYGKVSKLVDGLGKVAGEGLVLSSMKNTGYDRAKDVLIINDSRASAAGEEVSTAIARANDTYRAVVAYTGAEDRLNRGAKGKMLPEDAVKYDKLVQEVSAGVLMARQGLPASISKENLDLVPYWERELKEDPKLVERLEGDVNNALQAVSSINKGVAVDYAAMRGERSIEAMKPKYYTIASQIAAIPDMEKRHVVIVRDPVNKAAAVILPAGASLEVNNEVPGMNKNRLVIALKKEGIEDVQFYNAGGALGLHQPNEFFVDKTVEVARLKQFEIQTVETLDLKDEIARTSKVEIDQVSMIRDDDNKHVLYVKPANGESFTIYPEADDIRAFFANLKNPDKFDAIRETLGQKYYAFVQNHPEFKANVLMPDVNADLDLSRITKVNIVKDKNKEKSYIMFATIDGESQKPREVSGVQAQRMWLVDDKDMYKVRLAALLFEEKLGITEGQATAQFRDDHEGQGVDNAQEAPEQEEQEEQQQGRRGGFRR